MRDHAFRRSEGFRFDAVLRNAQLDELGLDRLHHRRRAAEMDVPSANIRHGVHDEVFGDRAFGAHPGGAGRPRHGRRDMKIFMAAL